jgi:hypothetical protein
MHQLVQAAIDAANSGDNRRAQGYLKQVLTENPNEAEGWLVLAAILEDPEKKRQCLNRVLALEPTNQIAREELLGMDRAAFSSRPAAEPEIASAPLKPSQAWAETVSEPVQPATPPRPAQPSSRLSKTLVFTYPLWLKILTYLAAALLGFFTVAMLCTSPADAFIPGVIGLLSLGSLWVVSARVEVSNEGIQSSRWVTGKSKIAWNEIVEFKSAATGQNLNLIAQDGRKVSVTAQVGGYAQIVEVLRRKRPDLFNLQPSERSGITAQASTFSGEKTFKRSSVGSIIGYALGLVSLVFGGWGMLNYQANSSNLILGLVFFFFGLYLLGANLLAIQEVVIRPQQITIVGNFGEEELTRDQIAKIEMKSQRQRRGRVVNFVVIQRASGKTLSINGLSGGPELLYGTLMNWWQSAR